MFDRLRTWVLRVMRVPHDPSPPFGAPGSIRIFRAGRNEYKLRLVGWGVGQAFGVMGIVFSVMFLNWLNAGAPRFSAMLAETKAKLAAPAGVAATPPAAVAPAPAPAATTPAAAPTATPAGPATPTPQQLERIPEGKRPPPKAKRINPKTRQNLARIAAQSWWALPLANVLESLAIIAFLVQLPLSYAAVRLKFEQHWYIVTDRSLRIRTGLWSLQESTMSFANLQQVEMKQGPLQRLLGLGDVHVQSAGGGGDYDPTHGHGVDSLHTGIFQNVENAEEIRDLILARLRLFRQAGLGDHDDPNTHVAEMAPPLLDAPATPADALSAAHELLAEARALRSALSS